MAFSQPFKFLCLFLVLGISLAQPGSPQPPDSESFCDSLYYYEEYEYCPEVSEPVCAKYQVPCDYGYCPDVYITYPSGCDACQDEDVISYTFGPCEEYCDENCEGDCPEDCEVWYEEEEEGCEDCEEECEDCEEEEECEDCEEEEEPGCEEENCEEEEEEEKSCTPIPGKKVYCSQDYIPVCGHYLECLNGACSKTFKNACLACYYGFVDYYMDGVCPRG